MRGDDMIVSRHPFLSTSRSIRKKGSIPQGIIDSITSLFPEIKNNFIFPELYFSEEEPKRYTTGQYDSDEIKKKLDDLRKKYEELYPNYKDLISRYTDGEAKWNLINDAGKTNGPEWMDDLAGDAREIFENEKVTLVTFGYFDSATNEITIYEKAFDDVCSEEEKAAKKRMTIAHEIFHAVHYFLAPKTYCEESYYANVVKEALADFYSYVLCLDSNAAAKDGIDERISNRVASYRLGFWEKYLFADTPYPNAIFCMYRNGKVNYDRTYEECKKNGSIVKMQNVLATSSCSMERAYYDLVPEYFRKKPKVSVKNAETNLYGRVGMASGGVRDVASVSLMSMIIWETLKQIIKDHGIGSLEELQAFFPKNTIRFVRGRFITFESGEILSEYPQWEIIDEDYFWRFIEREGCMPGMENPTVSETGRGKWNGVFYTPKGMKLAWRGTADFLTKVFQSLIDDSSITTYDDFVNVVLEGKCPISNKTLIPDITVEHTDTDRQFATWLIIDPDKVTFTRARIYHGAILKIGGKEYRLNTNVGEQDIYDVELFVRNKGYQFNRFYGNDPEDCAGKFTRKGCRR